MGWRLHEDRRQIDAQRSGSVEADVHGHLVALEITELR